MYTIEELAKIMKVTRRTIYRMLKNGKLPMAIKFGGSWRFPKDKIDRMIK